jgi:hypothetical protein
MPKFTKRQAAAMMAELFDNREAWRNNCTLAAWIARYTWELDDRRNPRHWFERERVLAEFFAAGYSADYGCGRQGSDDNDHFRYLVGQFLSLLQRTGGTNSGFSIALSQYAKNPEKSFADWRRES